MMTSSSIFSQGQRRLPIRTMELNANGGNRRFICIQLPEPTDKTSEAAKAGYKNICEIGKERIRRAGEKLRQQLKSNSGFSDDYSNGSGNIGSRKELDIGFKVFKLDSSNLRKWQPDYGAL